MVCSVAGGHFGEVVVDLEWLFDRFVCAKTS